MTLPPTVTSALDSGPALEAELRRLVVEDVFERLAAGFADGRRRRGLPAETEESLRELFAGTFRLLLRTFSILYAEARGALPLGGAPAYARYGMARIRRAAAERVDAGERLGEQTELWTALVDLFHLLDHGDPALGVPGRGGGLLPREDERSRFLRENPIADAFLARALDRLSRQGGEWIDYAALNAAQVAALLEGVLELRLVPDERGRPRLADLRGGSRGAASPAAPPWVVEYAVEETLAPALAERAAAYRAAMDQIADRQERLAAGGGEPPARLQREIQAIGARAADALLDLRVCDPALGGGRFLLHAAGWIAARLAPLAAEFPEGPLAARLAAVRAGIAADLRAQGIDAETADPGDEDLLRRLVVRHSLFGVDADPLAVELAAAALQLAALVPGAPPPLLEHHLRCGSALVGTRVAAVERALEESPQGQFLAFGGPFQQLLSALRPLAEAAEGDDAGCADAAEAEARYDEAERSLAPYRRLLDLWLSRVFGNPRAEEAATLHPDEVLAAARGAEPPFGAALREAVQQAAALAREHGFFHWDLEFPEAFADPARGAWRDDPGFDAVLGRVPAAWPHPPAPLRPHLAGAYARVHETAADPAGYYWQLGVELLRPGGRAALVAGSRWLRAGQGEGVRRFLAGSAELEAVVDLGQAAGLRDACVAVVRRTGGAESGEGDARVAVIPAEAGRPGLSAWVAGHAHAVPRARFGAAPWSLEPQAVEALLRRVLAAGVALRDYAGAVPFSGIRTGRNDAFLLDGAARARIVAEDPASAEVIRPFLRGQDVERWSPAWADRWLILARRGIEIDRYPGVRRHLEGFRAQLEPRPAEWEGERWEGRRAGGFRWCELQDPVDAWERFEGPKLVWRDLSFQSQFCLDDTGSYTDDLCVALDVADPWLLAVLNSPLMWFYLWRVVAHGRDEVVRLKNVYVEALPVAPPGEDTRAEAEAAAGRLVELSRERGALAGELLGWLAEEYGVARAGERLEAFTEVNATEFVDEVRRRRPRQAAPLAPREVGMLRNAHAEYAPRLTAVQAKVAGLERRLAQLVNRAYGLTAGEVELMWSSAPPRMPGAR
ncbi:MAG TPA: TaqI-like C-terminal specificity domain-containing protein [Longimicrobiaceae bacterium]|nr:TaqI-like C-terminal specificity domain-containing protein [Longimicrobiaceae bacterium]